MGLMVVDWIMYAGLLAIWVLIWAGYYLWTELTGRGGFVAWVACLILTAAASLVYYVVTDLVWGAIFPSQNFLLVGDDTSQARGLDLRHI